MHRTAWTGLKIFSVLVVSLVAAAAVAPQTVDARSRAQEQTIIGYVETLRLPDYDFDVKAKVDTGARSSSIDARDKEFFRKNGKDWVRFRILNNGGDDHVLEMPIHRYVRIRRAGTEMVRRPIVRLRVCFAGKEYLIEVNLTQRPQMNYRMLLGRKFLNGRFLIDPEKTFLTKPGCRKSGKR